MKKIEKRKCRKCGHVIAFRVKAIEEHKCPCCGEKNLVEREVQFELIVNQAQPQVSIFSGRLNKEIS